MYSLVCQTEFVYVLDGVGGIGAGSFGGAQNVAKWDLVCIMGYQ